MIKQNYISTLAFRYNLRYLSKIAFQLNLNEQSYYKPDNIG